MNESDVLKQKKKMAENPSISFDGKIDEAI